MFPEINEEDVNKCVKDFSIVNKIASGANPIRQGAGAIATASTGLKKLSSLCRFSDNFEHLQSEGFSDMASRVGALGKCAVGATTFAGGAGLLGISVLTLETPPVSASSFVAGGMLLGKIDESSKLAGHYLPIWVDAIIDKSTNLYHSGMSFISNTYQKWTGDSNLQKKQYSDIEIAMLDFGYEKHTEALFTKCDDNKQLIYSAFTRDLFNKHFKLNEDNTLGARTARYNHANQCKIDDSMLVNELNEIQKTLIDEGKISQTLREQNKDLQKHLDPLITTINSQAPAKRELPSESKIIVQNAVDFCETFQVVGQGVALAALISGNHRVAHQIINGSIAASQVVMGLANIAQNGLSMGPVGLVLGGVNMLISSFAEDNSGEVFEALAEQLAVISSQIHALHEDMLIQFEKVFTALGIINSNILEGFKLLHEDHKNIFKNLKRLQRDLEFLQDNLNAVGEEVRGLRSELRGYVLEDDRKQFVLELNKAKERSKRPFNRLELQPAVLASFKTFNVELISKQLNGQRVTSTEVSRALTTHIGSAEANIGLLLNYAKHELGLNVEEPIADPKQWQHCVELLLEILQKDRAQAISGKVIGEQDYQDFQYLKQIGDNWLGLIKQFTPHEGRRSILTLLFQKYKANVNDLVELLEEAQLEYEKENIIDKKQPHKGMEELKQQQSFAFDFRRNSSFLTLTADWSRCKGFNNPPRNLNYDAYYSEWQTHIQSRRDEISKNLDAYQAEIEQQVEKYKDSKLGLFDVQNVRLVSRSGFMLHEQNADKMPLLPLLPAFANLKVDPLIYQAELLNLGNIVHYYRFESGKFICSSKFHWENSKVQPTLICTASIDCHPLDHLNKEESAWHEYMGGTYPKNNTNYSLRYGQATSPNGDYHVRHDCTVPEMQTFSGMRRQASVDLSYSSVASIFAAEVKKRLKNLRLEHNDRLQRLLGANDTKNPIVNALQAVDASAKLLLAFISIAYRDGYQKPPAIWARDEILDYVYNYRGQSNYLTHQLMANVEQLGEVENKLNEQLAQQEEIAYAPVRETLAKLHEFIEEYENRVVDDAALAAEQAVKEKGDAVLFGASQAALKIQSELIRAGHTDAALHIAQVLMQSGFGRLTLTPAQQGEDPLTPRPVLLFSGASGSSSVLSLTAPAPARTDNGSGLEQKNKMGL